MLNLYILFPQIFNTYKKKRKSHSNLNISLPPIFPKRCTLTRFILIDCFIWFLYIHLTKTLQKKQGVKSTLKNKYQGCPQ